MDGHFVPNITIGPLVVKALRDHSSLPFDVHLMIEPVDPYIELFAKAGADIMTIHAEAVTHMDRTVQQIKSFGKKVGVSLVPTTHPDALDYILPALDLVLVMSVNPGFGGQSFMNNQLQKISIIREKINKLGKPIELEVDGGINHETAKSVIQAGADVLVAGAYIFQGGPSQYSSNIRKLRL
jgi:ribulose-phosphate 3-epimerase